MIFSLCEHLDKVYGFLPLVGKSIPHKNTEKDSYNEKSFKDQHFYVIVN